MDNLLTFLLASLGATLVINRSDLFSSLRSVWHRKFNYPWKLFLHCPQCIGFWTGFAFHWFSFGVSPHWFVDACMASGFCSMVHKLVWKQIIIDD